MINLTKLLLVFLIPMIAWSVQAQETDENTRTEYIICKLKEGKTLQDVVEHSKKYAAIAKENGSKYNQYLMEPFMTGSRWAEQGYTHAIVGVWPNGLEMYREYGNYYNGEQVDQSDSPHTCDITVSSLDTIVANKMKMDEPQDLKSPVQITDCNLNPGVTLDHAISVHREWADALDKMGLDGFLMTVNQPYLGQNEADNPPDFTLTMSFQSFEHRAQMAMNYYKAEEWDQRLNALGQCSNPRAYVGQLLYRNW